MKFFTADTHFSYKDNNILYRDFRPFKTLEEMNDKIIDIWNEQVTKDDVIYFLGDFVNYNWEDLDYEKTLGLVRKINAKVVLILGNHEERILNNDFDNNFENFRKYLISLGFYDAVRHDLTLKIGGHDYYLTHKPCDCNKNSEYNLFGHVHKSVFVKRYGFNVGLDNCYLKLFSEDDIIEMKERRKLFDENVYD